MSKESQCHSQIFVVGEFKLADPSFRTNSRIIAIKSVDGQVRFALEYQHEGEKGVWLSEPSFPWHEKNFDAIICAAARFHERIEVIIKYRKRKKKEK